MQAKGLSLFSPLTNKPARGSTWSRLHDAVSHLQSLGCVRGAFGLLNIVGGESPFNITGTAVDVETELQVNVIGVSDDGDTCCTWWQEYGVHYVTDELELMLEVGRPYAGRGVKDEYDVSSTFCSFIFCYRHKLKVLCPRFILFTFIYCVFKLTPTFCL